MAELLSRQPNCGRYVGIITQARGTINKVRVKLYSVFRREFTALMICPAAVRKMQKEEDTRKNVIDTHLHTKCRRIMEKYISMNYKAHTPIFCE